MHYKELKRAWGELTAPGAPFEIETIEVRGTPMRTYKNAPGTVRALWMASSQFAEREFRSPTGRRSLRRHAFLDGLACARPAHRLFESTAALHVGVWLPVVSGDADDPHLRQARRSRHPLHRDAVASEESWRERADPT